MGTIAIDGKEMKCGGMMYKMAVQIGNEHEYTVLLLVSPDFGGAVKMVVWTDEEYQVVNWDRIGGWRYGEKHSY